MDFVVENGQTCFIETCHHGWMSIQISFPRFLEKDILETDQREYLLVEWF